MRTDRLNRILGALGVLAMVAGCSSPSTTTSQSSSESSSAAGQTIKIGMDLPLSGGDASNGIPTRNGAMLAIDEANAKAVPGGFKFAAYDLDDAVQGKHDPGQGAQNVKSFVADSATLAMMGPFNSNVARAEIPVTNDAGMVQISPSNTNTALTTPPDSIKLRPSHPDVNTYFRVCTRDDKQGAANAQYARKLGYKSAFIVDDNETYGKGLADVFDATFTKLGGTVLSHEHLTSGQTDYKALLTKGQALKPDVVFYGGTSVTGGGLLRKQMADAGMGTLPFFGGDGISDAEFLHIAGSAADGAVYTVAAPDASKLPSAAKFVAAYKKKYGGDVGPYSANAYTIVAIEIAAIEKAITANKNAMPSRADVLANVASTSGFASPIGSVGFDKNGDTTAPILSFYKIAGGKATFVDQINLKN